MNASDTPTLSRFKVKGNTLDGGLEYSGSCSCGFTITGFIPPATIHDLNNGLKDYYRLITPGKEILKLDTFTELEALAKRNLEGHWRDCVKQPQPPTERLKQAAEELVTGTFNEELTACINLAIGQADDCLTEILETTLNNHFNEDELEPVKEFFSRLVAKTLSKLEEPLRLELFASWMKPLRDTGLIALAQVSEFVKASEGYQQAVRQGLLQAGIPETAIPPAQTEKIEGSNPSPVEGNA